MVVRGSGPPLVLIPGIQGRWEWMRPAVDALSASFTVATFSLIGEWGTGFRLRPDTPFDRHVEQIDRVLDRMGWTEAVVCGVSYGGGIAVRYAALRPERVRALVLASAIGPRWRPNDIERRYASSPWLSLPAFAAGAPFRLWPEIRAAVPGRLHACAAAARYLWLVVTAPTLPSHLANRVLSLDGHDLAADARSVRGPTLVITGERHLDQVVPADDTREYAALIPHASARTLEGTGHIGLVTKPRAFAALVASFVGSLPSPLPGTTR